MTTTSQLREGSGTESTGVGKPDYQALSRNAFDTSKTYFDSAIRNQIDADLRQFYGIHPAGSKYHAESYRGRSKIFRPKTRMAVRKNEAIAAEALFSTIDVVSISPEDEDDPIQHASSLIMQELIQFRLTKTIPWFVTTMGAYQDAQNVGICASYQYWRFERKGRRLIDQPCIDLIPPENLRFDPTSDWRDVVGTSPYLIHMIPMYVKDVQARMQAVDPKTRQPKWKQAEKSLIVAAQMPYMDSTRSIREDKRPDSSNADRGVTEFSVVWVHRIFMEINGQDMVWYCLANNFFMLTEPVAIEEMYWHGKRPYQIGFCVVETHKTHPSGVSRLTKEQQAEINEIANSRIDNVKLAMTKRWKAKRGKMVDVRSLTRNIPGSVTMMTDLEDAEPIEFDDVTASSYQEQDRLNLDFDDMAGTFSQSSVQSNKNLNETVGGLNLVAGTTNQVSAYQLRIWIETWLEPVLRQLVLLEQYYEDDQVILALAGKRGGLLQKFGINAITDELLMQELTVNVNVGMGATNPQQQVERFMFGLEKLKEILSDGVIEQHGGDAVEIAREIMGKLGYRDGKRFFPDKGVDPAQEMLQQQVAQLQQQLAAKRPPQELIDAQVQESQAKVALLEAQAAQIEQQIGVDAEQLTVENEVEAQIAEIQKAADEQVAAANQQVAQMKGDQTLARDTMASKETTAKYAVDKKADTDLERAKIAAKTQERLGAVKARTEAMKTRVAAMKAKSAKGPAK